MKINPINNYQINQKYTRKVNNNPVFGAKLRALSPQVKEHFEWCISSAPHRMSHLRSSMLKFKQIYPNKVIEVSIVPGYSEKMLFHNPESGEYISFESAHYGRWRDSFEPAFDFMTSESEQAKQFWEGKAGSLWDDEYSPGVEIL